MTWLLAALAAVLAGELFVHLPIAATVGQVVKVARKSARTLGSDRVSDHWKERVLQAYALQIAKGSLAFLLLLCILALPFVLLGLAAEEGLSAWFAELLRLPIMLLICVVSIGYVILRQSRRHG